MQADKLPDPRDREHCKRQEESRFTLELSKQESRMSLASRGMIYVFNSSGNSIARVHFQPWWE